MSVNQKNGGHDFLDFNQMTVGVGTEKKFNSKEKIKMEATSGRWKRG